MPLLTRNFQGLPPPYRKMKFKISFGAFFLFFLAGFSAFAAIPPAEDLLPADTLAVVTVPDCNAMRGALQQFPLWLFWNGPEMQPFHDDFMAKWNQKFSLPQEQNLSVKLDDFLPLLQGQLTFAITENGWGGSGNTAPATLVLLDTKDKSDLLATNLAALEKAWRNAGRPMRTEVIQDIKFTVVTFSTTNPPPSFPSGPPATGGGSTSVNTLYVGQFKSLLIAGSSVKAVESVVAHLNGGANPALADNALFHHDQLSQLYNSPLMYGWFNAKDFFSAISQAPLTENSGLMPFSWNGVLLASGLEDLRSFCFSYRQSRDGTQMEFFADVPANAREGIFKILAPEPKDANPPPFVPADAIKFSRWRIDDQQSWAELEKTLTAISPAALSYLNAMISTINANAQTQDPDFDLKKDLIDNLGDDWISFDKAPDGNTIQDINNAPWLFLIGANNADKAALTIKTLGGVLSAASTPQSRDFLGRKIYTIPFGSHGPAGANGAAQASRPLYCTASGGYIALSMDVSMIENYLRSDDGKTKPLSQIPGLLDAAQHVGGMGNGVFGYQNQRELMRMLFTALKDDPNTATTLFSGLSATPYASAGNNLRDMANFSLLPPYGQVAKYFNFNVYGGSATSEGLDVKFFEPRSPGLN
jgi:hypothetical protein